MNEQKLKLGMISTANIERWALIPAMRKARNCELVAVSSRSEEKARSFAAQYEIPKSYGSYEALLMSDDIDAVYVPVPNSLHREWTIKAAEAGKHILCEKPMALNSAQSVEMDLAAQRNGVRLMEAFMYRFHPQTEKVIELVRSGVIGEPRLVYAVFSFRVTNPADIRLQPDLGGGSLMDVGSYCVNISRTLANAEPVEVQAFANWGSTGVDDEMVGTLRFANGLCAQFSSGLTLERREFYQIAGSEGYIEVSSAFLPGTKDNTIYEYHGRSGVTSYTIAGIDEYQLMVEHFADCVINKKPFRYPVAEATANMGVIEALYRSARNGGKPEQI